MEGGHESIVYLAAVVVVAAVCSRKCIQSAEGIEEKSEKIKGVHCERDGGEGPRRRDSLAAGGDEGGSDGIRGMSRNNRAAIRAFAPTTGGATARLVARQAGKEKHYEVANKPLYKEQSATNEPSNH
ncbi:hypothetical protein KM043_017213 [Ampulex compressa]|nr:hypothetical protein KM043_017213 [Ampulex compressa]